MQNTLAALPAESANQTVSQLSALWTTPAPLFFVSGIERISAIILHIGLSLLIYRAVKAGKCRTAAFTAVLAYGIHFIVDFFAVAGPALPREEVAFIHEFNTETKKADLFAKVRAGQVRILMGSTPKLGAGTNIQDRLIALHHLDCPWKPSDLEQQEGRILRQGNRNKQVKIYRYVTENTFDSYMWQILENKRKFISQIMTSKSPVRACDDVDDTALSYAEIKARRMEVP